MFTLVTILFKMCADFGDCCPDYQEVCGTAFADECEDREASVSNQAGKMSIFGIILSTSGPEISRSICLSRFQF